MGKALEYLHVEILAAINFNLAHVVGTSDNLGLGCDNSPSLVFFAHLGLDSCSDCIAGSLGILKIISRGLGETTAHLSHVC